MADDAGSSASFGGDVLSGTARFGGSGGKGARELDYSRLGKEFASAMGMATLMADSVYDRKFASVCALVGARTAPEREMLEVTCAFYFGVHGTSPDTNWYSYDHPFVFQGVPFQPYDVVELIGSGSLKQFCGRYSRHVSQLHTHSVEFRRSLLERATRLGYTDADSYLVVDFYGKDGSLDPATMAAKSVARSNALMYRASNTVGVGEQRRQTVASERVKEAPVVPEVLGRSFKK